MASEKFTPDWTNQPPAPGSYRSIFKLGAPDEFKHPRAELVAMMMDEFGMSERDLRTKQYEGNEPVVANRKTAFSGEQIGRFQEFVGAENVSVSDYDRVKFSSGQTILEVTELRRGRAAHVTDLVVHPRDKNDVARIVAYCHQEKIPITVYAGGSSVVQGLTPERGGVTLVMTTHMNKLLKINDLNHSATVQPGMMGPAFEDALNHAPERFQSKRAYTCGHFPQSFEISAVGGWIAALGSGQASTYYGDACDLVLSQEYVTPAGTIKTLDYPGTATGPRVNHMLTGSEGAFGILVEATVKIFRYTPETRQYFAFMFPTWEAAVDASREVVQSGFGAPAVFRISDPEETDRGLKLYGFDSKIAERFLALRGMKPMQRCILMGTAEGEAGFARHVKACVRRVCRAHGAMALPSFVVKAWEKTRYKEPLMREDFMDFGIITDTLETGVTWDNLLNLHREVRAFIKSRPGAICMTHASHFYAHGTNLYFIFVLKPETLEEYFAFHREVVGRIVAAGGSLSHHHGVGRLLAPWMEAHLGAAQVDALRALKSHFDPNGIMSPGAQLGLGPRVDKG